jgi:hypothetical protein
MRFIKINHPGGRIKNIGDPNEAPYWCLVIDNIPDLLRYKDMEVECTGYHFVHMDDKLWELVKNEPSSVEMYVKVHPEIDDRQKGLARMLASKVASAPEGEKVHGLIEVGSYLDKKFDKMAIRIAEGKTLLIKPGGSYSDMASYFSDWGCKILEEVDGINGFPRDGETLKVKTLIIENAPMVQNDFIQRIQKLYPGSIGSILEAKTTDERYIYQCINNAENICIMTEANDLIQINGMMKIFANVHRKNVYIETSKKGKENIVNDPIFKDVEFKHSINFIVCFA